MYCRASSSATILVLLPLLAQAAGEAELFFKGTGEVNEGALHFLTQAPATPVHHHHNRITLTPDSLQSGWIRLEQCHRDLDPVPASQIVFGEGRVRELRLTRTEGIERAWVAGHTVQLAGVAPGALLCLAAETRALSAEPQGGYRLDNGPYMRRFLDGYYPMRVTLEVAYPEPPLRLIDVTPPPQPGLSLEAGTGTLRIEALFEGQLRTRIRFRPATPAEPGRDPRR